LRPDIVIYHGNCADGFTSAWVFKQKFGEDGIEYYAATHGSIPPSVKGKNVFILDFSYKRKILEDMASDANSLIVIDHHISAQSDLNESSLQNIINANFNINDYLACGESNSGMTLFDMSRSGAGMAWDFCFPEEERPKIVDFVEDRDLWKFEIEGSREIASLIFSHDYNFNNWDKLNNSINENTEKCFAFGMAINKKMDKDISELIKQCKRPMVIGGHVVPVANIPYTMASDAGNIMASQEFHSPVVGDMIMPEFAACYYDTSRSRVFSLRSLKGGADVSRIASSYGGGGHKNASGFRMDIGWEGDSHI